MGSRCCRPNSAIYQVRQHGTGLQRLTSPRYLNNDVDPSASPQGNRIVFAVRTHLCVPAALNTLLGHLVGLFCFGEGPAKLVGDRHAPRFRWGDLGPMEGWRPLGAGRSRRRWLLQTGPAVGLGCARLGRPGWGGAVDLPADQSTRTSASRLQPPPTAPLRSPRRRRPSGEAPPLPHHLQTTGVGWLVASVVLVALSMVVFAGGLRGPAVAVTVLTTPWSAGWPGWTRPGWCGAGRRWPPSARGGSSTPWRWGWPWRCWRCGGSGT